MSVAVPSAAAALERLPVAGIAVLSLGALDFGLEQSLILPALPSLADHYDASLVGVSWLATGFLVTGTVAVPLLGRLGDLYGRRLLLLVALGAFAAGSLVCALTDSIELAIAGRCVQGLGVAFSPLALGLARDTLPAGMLPRAVGAVVGAASVGSTLGFLLSGVLVDNISPASIFWLLFVLAAVLVVGVLTLVPEVPARTHVSLDLAGAATLALGLFTLLLAISKGNDWDWTSGVILALLAAAACSLTLFVLLERRVAQPLVDLALVVRKPFANANVCAFAFGYAFFIAVFVVPQIAAAPAATGYGQGLSTTEIGLLLVPTGIGGMLGAWLGGRAVDSVGPRALVALGSLGGVGAYVSLMLEHNSWLGLSIPTAVLGFSAGLILTGIYPVVLRSSGTDKTGVAVAIAFVMRNTAVSLGVAAAFAIIDGAGLVGGFPADGGFTRAFGMGAAGAAVGFVASAFMPGRAVRAAA